jgi:hypothetical protein
VVRTFVYGFAIYGIARIAYLVAFHPAILNGSPLSRLLSRMTH